MCLGVPGKITEMNGAMGKVEFSGVRREIHLGLVDEVAIGDWVLVHAGFAIQKLDAEEAQKTLDLLKEFAEASLRP